MRLWLKDLSREDRKAIGEDLKLVQFQEIRAGSEKRLESGAEPQKSVAEREVVA